MKERELHIGDIVKLIGPESEHLGKVVEFADDGMLVNNSDAWFDFDSWEYVILHSDHAKSF